MAFFWLLMLGLLLAVIGYAAFADFQARKRGKVLVPVKQGFGRRTSFVAVDREELDLKKAELALQEEQKKRAELRGMQIGEIQTAYNPRKILQAARRMIRF